MEQQIKEDRFSAVYVAYSTFNTALDILKEGIPPKIDRTVFRGQSGGTQAQIMSAFRSLGLIDEDGAPNALLSRLVKEDTRKQTLRSVLEEEYREVIALHAANATERQVLEKMAEFNVSGATLRKANAFFVRAAADVGIPLSPHATKSRAAGTVGQTQNGPRKARGRRSARPKAPIQRQDPVGSQGPGETLTVELTGGHVTLNVAVRITEMSVGDLEWLQTVMGFFRNYKN
jgi:hypothetical protein